MARPLEADGIQGCGCLGIRSPHGTELEVPARQLVGDPGHLALGAPAQAQALPLVLLGIRQPGIDGEHQRRVAAIAGDPLCLCSCGEQDPLAARPPQLAIERAAHQARLIELGCVADQSVARKLKAPDIGTGRPLLDGDSRLHHALALEQAARALLINHIERRIHLAAHRIGSDAEQTANTRPPRRPSRRVKRRDAPERHVRTASQALRRRDADAHAGKGPGAAPHQKGVDIRDALAGIAQDLVHRIHQLDVGATAAEMVALSEQLDMRAGSIARGRPLRRRAGEHIGRGIDGNN